MCAHTRKHFLYMQNIQESRQKMQHGGGWASVLHLSGDAEQEVVLWLPGIEAKGGGTHRLEGGGISGGWSLSGIECTAVCLSKLTGTYAKKEFA